MKTTRAAVLRRGVLGHDISLKDCLSLWKGVEGALGILYGPGTCQFVRLDPSDGSPRVRNGKPDLSLVFEARLFCSKGEMRWLLREGRGTATLIDEGVFPAPEGFQAETCPCEALDQDYLVWGRLVSSATEGWAETASARIGTLDLPVDQGTPGERAALRTLEYMAPMDHGNMCVVEERLVAVEIVQ